MSQAEIGNLLVRMGIDTAEFMNGVKSVRSSLSTLNSALKGFGAAFSASLVFDAAVGAMKAVAEIGDVAESIGVSAEQLQAFNRMAIASGTSTDVLTRGLQSIAEQSVDAESKLSKLFEANGLIVKGKETNEIIREFMELVRNAASPTEQLAIITGVLGDKVGRQLVEAFREGAAGADEATREMIASGEYHTNAEVKRLQELETKYNRVTDRIGIYWQQMVVGMVTTASRMQQEWSSGKPSAASELWNWITGQPVHDWNIMTGEAIGGGWSGQSQLGPVGLGGWNIPPGGVKPTVLPPPKPDKPAKPEKIVPPGTIEDIYGAGEAVSALEENFQDAIDGAGLFSDSLMQIGDTITGGLSDAISGLVMGTMSVQDAFRFMAEDIVRTLSDMAAQLLVNGGMQMLMQALGSGGGAGLNVGGMTFGGLFANGGTLGAGQWGIAGEAGPEIVHGPARITPMGGGGVKVNIINQSNAKVSADSQQMADGSINIRALVQDEVIDTLGGGRAARVMGGRFGARVMPRRV